MKTLIVEDDFTSRFLMQELLRGYGQCHVAVNGKEAIAAASLALENNEPYDLICLDIMMPEMDGQQALKEIRNLEGSRGSLAGAKVIMTTALADIRNVADAYHNLCDDYLTKPIRKEKLIASLKKLDLIQE